MEVGSLSCHLQGVKNEGHSDKLWTILVSGNIMLLLKLIITEHARQPGCNSCQLSVREVPRIHV